MKRYSLQNRVRKFTPKKFYEIDPRLKVRVIFHVYQKTNNALRFHLLVKCIFAMCWRHRYLREADFSKHISLQKLPLLQKR